MQYVLYSNGVRLEWDENIQVGMLIRTYHSGYWILERIEFREEPDVIAGQDPKWYPHIVERSQNDKMQVPIYYSVQVLRDDGTPSKRARKSCAASYCFKVTKDYMDKQREQEHALADSKANAIGQFL